MEQRCCKYCNAQLQPGAEACGNCGAYQYTTQQEAPTPYPQYSSPLQPPTGLGSPAMQPGQQAFYMQAPPVSLAVKPRSSGFAITSMILGILATILMPFDLILDGGAALEGNSNARANLAVILVLTLICWTPALIALIFGLLAKGKIQRSEEQIRGLGLAYAGIILSSISLVLPLLGILIFAITSF